MSQDIFINTSILLISCVENQFAKRSSQREKRKNNVLVILELRGKGDEFE